MNVRITIRVVLPLPRSWYACRSSPRRTAIAIQMRYRSPMRCRSDDNIVLDDVIVLDVAPGCRTVHA